MKTILRSVLIVGLAWWMWNCSRIQSYSEIPEIHFKSLSFDSIITDLDTVKNAILIFSFIDGDGDIGVKPSGDSISKIHYTWYKKLPDRTYEAYQFPQTGTVADSTVIPYSSVMNKDEAQNKTLKGWIQIALYMPNKPQDVDTMRIGYYIVDRARHKSNVDYTPDFSILNASGPVEAK